MLFHEPISISEQTLRKKAHRIDRQNKS